MRVLLVGAAAVAATLFSGCKNQPMVNPVAGDHVEPELRVLEPVAAAFVAQGTTVVRGESAGLEDLQVDGQAVEVDEDGDWQTTMDVVRGIHTFEVSGVDDTGHRIFLRQSVMAGEFGKASGPIEDGLAVRLNQGGLDALTGLVLGMLDPSMVTGALAGINPVYEDSYNILFWEAVEIRADISSLWFKQPQIDLTPANGRMDVEIVLPELLVTVPAAGEVIGIDFDVECTLTAEEVVIGGRLVLGTDGNGHLTAELHDPTVQLVGFFFDTTLLPGEIEDWLLSDTVRGVVEEMLLEQIATLVPPLLEDQLATLELAFDTELFGLALGVEAGFDTVAVDRDGVVLMADLDVGIGGDRSGKSSPGYLLSDAGAPTPSRSADLAMVVSDDLLNRLLHDAWQAGLVDLTIDSKDGTVDPSMFKALGAADEASMVLNAALPPVVVQRGDDTFLEMGEVGLKLMTPGGGLGSELDLSVSASIPVDLEIEDSALTLAMGVADMQFMVRDSDWGVSNETITVMLEHEIPVDVLLLMLGDIEIPLPSIGDLALPDARIDRDATGTFTTIEVDL